MTNTIKHTTLANGMRLVHVPIEGIKSLAVLAMVGVGSRDEDPQKAGISHFLEHLPFKGTKNYPEALDISTAIDGVGGKHNAYTSKEYTGYWVKCAASQYHVALDVVSDLLLTAHLRPEDIAKEKGVIVEEINMYEDQPQAKVHNLFDELVFAGTKLEGDVIGTKDTVTSLTAADFRAHYDTWYDPSNVVIGIVGDLDQIAPKEADMIAKVEEYFAKGKARQGGGEHDFSGKEQTEPRLNIFYKDTEQAHFLLGFPGLPREHKDRYVLSVLATILGGNSSSRLFNEIREKRGLAYYAYASVDSYHDRGSIYALEGVSLKDIEEAIKVTIGEFESMAAGKTVTADDVKRAQEFIIGKTTLDLEDSANVASFYVRRLLLEGKITAIDDILEQIRAVTLDQVVALAKELLDPTKFNLAVIGPYKDSAKFEALLK